MRKRILITLCGNLFGVVALALVLAWAVGAQGPEPGLSFQHVDTFGEMYVPYTSTTTHLNYPYALAVDGADNVYIAERGGHRVLKYDSEGNYQNLQIGITGVSCWWCWGEGGEGLVLDRPSGLAVDSSDNIWVAERGASRLSIFAPDGTYTGQLGVFRERGSDNEHFNRPEGVAFDSAGRIYVADLRNNRVQIFDPTRAYSATIGGTCGPGDSQLCEPQGLAIDSDDVLYIADTGNARVQVYQLVGDSMVFSQSITIPGSAEDRWAPGVAVDANYLYVIETGWDNRVHVFSRSGVYSSAIDGHCWDEDPWFCSPRDVAVDSKGNVYVADASDYLWVTKCNGGPNWVCTPFAGTKGVPYPPDDRHLNGPADVAVWGNSLFMIENHGQRLLKLDTSGQPQWTVGEAGVEGSDNDHFRSPAAVAVDSNYRSYVADTSNQRVQIFSSDGSYSTTLGDGDCNPDDGIGDTEFCEPQGVAIGPGDVIYVADTGNHRVQIFDSDGSYYDTLGTPGVPGDDNDHFDAPGGVTVDSNGNIYVGDWGNHRVQIFDSSLAYTMTLGPTGGGDFADAGGPYTANEGDPVTLDASGSSDPSGFYEFREPDVAVDNNSGRIYVGDVWDWIEVFERNGHYLTTIGAHGHVDVDSEGYVYVADAARHCAQKFAPDGSPPTPPTVSYEWDLDNDGEYDDATGITKTVIFTDNDSHTVGLRVTGDLGESDTDTAIVTVNNVMPTIDSITAPVDPVSINDQPVNVTVEFSDPGTADTHDVTWDWGDLGTPDTQTNATSPATQDHLYAEPGVYTVQVTITDDDGSLASQTYEYIVIYNPEGGFVTGGGWINSPEGAYTPDPLLTDKATFGFVAKYKKGTDAPTGETEFRFRVADLNFHSDTYQWLVVAGPKAQFKGTGTINGAGDYGFMLTAIDAALTPSTDEDLFRIKIWDKDNGEAIVYDNQMGDADDADPATVLGGGSIVIHKEK
jgi:PKD repeat protein